MPLLGRHKSTAAASQREQPAASSSGQRSQQQQQQQEQQVCESPLFGTRRLLDGKHQHHQQVEVPAQMSREQIHYAFAIMDTNRDGLIDLHELSQMLANLGLPIDEAILAHVMASASLRGDQRLSEDEFLAWISGVVQVIGDQVDQQQQQQRRPEVASTRRSLRSTARRSQGGVSNASSSSTSTSAAMLVASSPDEPPAGPLRQRRGSGSGLALMRSLSGPTNSGTSSPTSSPTSTRTSQRKQQPPDDADEARDDLRAAFGVFDLDGDGFITLDEVRQGLQLLGESWTPQELRQMFASTQQQQRPHHLEQPSDQAASSSGRISIDDFVRLLL